MSALSELGPVIKRMEEEFASRPYNERVALSIVSIHRDVGFEPYLQLKDDHVVANYYASRWKGAERAGVTRDYCRLADSLMETVWFPTFNRIRKELTV